MEGVMKRVLYVAGVVACMQFYLYGMLETTGRPFVWMQLASSQERDELYSRKVESASSLEELLEIKATAEKNGYICTLSVVGERLSQVADPEQLGRYILSHCRNSKNPMTLDEISYRRHSIEIITALSLLRGSLQNIADQGMRLRALGFYNAICGTIQSWDSNDE